MAKDKDIDQQIETLAQETLDEQNALLQGINSITKKSQAAGFGDNPPPAAIFSVLAKRTDQKAGKFAKDKIMPIVDDLVKQNNRKGKVSEDDIKDSLSKILDELRKAEFITKESQDDHKKSINQGQSASQPDFANQFTKLLNARNNETDFSLKDKVMFGVGHFLKSLNLNRLGDFVLNRIDKTKRENISKFADEVGTTIKFMTDELSKNNEEQKGTLTAIGKYSSSLISEKYNPKGNDITR